MNAVMKVCEYAVTGANGCRERMHQLEVFMIRSYTG